MENESEQKTGRATKFYFYMEVSQGSQQLTYHCVGFIIDGEIHIDIVRECEDESSQNLLMKLLCIYTVY